MLILADIPIPKVEVGGNVLILSVVFFALLCRYLLACMRHKQILASIEKGLPLSNQKANKLQGPRWITNMTFGITLLLISPCIIVFGLALFDDFTPSKFFGLGPTGVLPVVTLFLGLALFAIGIAQLIRGLLQRKAEKAKTETENTANSTKSD